MKNLPTQALPVQRSTGVASIKNMIGADGYGGILAAACGPGAVGQGQCFDQNGPIGGPTAFNCAACCALRTSTHWQNAAGAFAICH